MKRQPSLNESPIVFDNRDYKDYILEGIRSQPGGGRGQKSRIAEALKCQLAYVSQVLTTHAHFSPEQADLLNRYFEHDEEGADFFLLLLHRGRAGTKSIEDYSDRKIHRVIDHRLLLKNRL